MLINVHKVLGIGLLGAMLAFNYFGLTMTQPDRVSNVPKTIRQNPGSYRSHYQTHYVHLGGK